MSRTPDLLPDAIKLQSRARRSGLRASVNSAGLAYYLPQSLRIGILQWAGAQNHPCTPSDTPSTASASQAGVSLSKGGLSARVLSSPEDIVLTHRLRHRVFVDKLKWVTGHNGLEIDEYDEGAVCMGVFEGAILRGMVRVVLPHQLFMLEKAFQDLLHNESLSKTPDTIEVSRLAIDPDMTDRRQKRRTLFLLHYLLYRWMRRNQMRSMYIVSTHKMIASIQRTRGAPVKTFGREGLTLDKLSYQAAVIDMQAIMGLRHRLQYFLQYLLI